MPREWIAALVALLLLLPRPVVAEEWFDAYLRGLEALKQKKGPRAVELLERAIRMRPEPGANLLTYGTNRLDEYYPYLRLAEAQLLAGNVQGTREALKRSEASGKEPVEQRVALLSRIEAVEKAQMAVVAPSPAAPAPPPTLAHGPPPTLAPAPPASVAPAPPDEPAAAPAAAASPGPATGTLDLRSDPSGAIVLLGDRLLGTTPLRVELAPGAYQVTLRKEGAADQSFPVRVTAGRASVEARALALTRPPASLAAAAAETASLVVFSDPPGASVYLDDEPLGATDGGSGRLVKSGIPSGPHRLRLSLAGHRDFTEEVQVGAAGPRTVRGALEASSGPPFLTIAAGLGVVALAGLGWLAWRRRAAEGPGSTVVLPRAATTPTSASGSSRATPSPRATKVGAATVEAGDLGLEELIETRAIPKGTTAAGVGERFGEYLLREPLGKGGMATVFLADRNGELCALKRPLPAFLDDPEFLERFLREAEIGRTLHHPNIIRIFERGHVSGVPYFTMELVKGETLQAHIRREGALAPKIASRVVAQVAEALDYAHLKGVVHRDLKPSNIMILEDGTVKVMDYGIARARRFEGLTVTGAFLGTPDYVAPETAEGKGTDARSDLYSLGIVFYEILTGKKPFVGDTPFATLRKHCTEPPTPPSALAPGCPRELEAIVLRLLAKDPNDRFPGAEELLIELREYLNRAA